ncbi:MAG: ribosome biogenesis protein [Euryarchaeota archaeon]|nr:ribosome biogenesis protein [Euryarchaeota archaeon]|tara:strand:+ start:1253 stop:1459 length:207 start_codon:yes stop_codon:yes gene_type:complete
MARQLIQKCQKCNAYSYELKCKKCGGNAQVAVPLKWTPEDTQAHRRRKFQDVSSDAWNETLPTFSEEE